MIDSGTEIIKFPKNGYLISPKLSEESIQILTKGLLFEEAFGLDKIDLSIDNNERLAPTIGIIDKLQHFNNSGRIIVMTDSSCMDSASPSLTKCYWLLDKFVKLASEENAIDASLMQKKF